MHIYYHESRRDNIIGYLHLVEICAIIIQQSLNLDELMYDDYDLDYTYCNDHSYDLEEYYTQELEEDYARDTHDLEALAYRHYA